MASGIKINNNYQEDVSLGLFNHKQAFSETATVEVTSSETEVLTYDVPSGYQLLLHSIDFSKGADEAITVSLTIEDVEEAGWNTLTAGSANLNSLKVSSGETVKVLGSGATTGDMSVNLFGTLIQTEIVPDTLTNFSVSASDSQIAINWTAPTSQDVGKYKIQWYPTATSTAIQTIVIEDLSVESYTLTDLVNGTEYTIQMCVVAEGSGGVPGSTSAISSDTATPTPFSVDAFLIAPEMGMSSNVIPSAYYISDDSGATWTEDNAISTLGFSGYESIVTLSDKVVSLFTDDVGSLDGQIGTFDNTSWTYNTDEDWNKLLKMGDLLVMGSSTNLYSTPDGSTLTAITGITGNIDFAASDGTNYVIHEEGSGTRSSTVGSGAFTLMTNQPTLFDRMVGLTGRIVTAAMDATTTVTYEYTTDNGDTAWSSGGTSSITATSATIRDMVSFNGNIFTVANEDDYSTSYIEMSDDSGATWSSVSIPGTSLIPLWMGSDGTNLYLYLSWSDDGFSTFTNYVSKWSGTEFGTPVQVGTAGASYVIGKPQGIS